MNRFYAMISRMKYIDRWGLMNNTRTENISEHSLETAILAHALVNIANIRLGENLNADRAAVIGMFHDAGEIITGDMPTPVKYYNSELKHAYKEVEAIADDKLLEKLPEDLRPSFEEIFKPADTEEERYMRKLVKAADKLSALIKCIGEINAGNNEFRTAKESTGKSIRSLYQELPEVIDFVNEFLSSYGSTLDELT